MNGKALLSTYREFLMISFPYAIPGRPGLWLAVYRTRGAIAVEQVRDYVTYGISGLRN
jgi:hypothetical protein